MQLAQGQVCGRLPSRPRGGRPKLSLETGEILEKRRPFADFVAVLGSVSGILHDNAYDRKATAASPRLYLCSF